MGIKSDVVIMINAVGMGHRLIEMLTERLVNNFSEDSDININLVALNNGMASSQDVAMLKLDCIPLGRELKELLDDWWIDDCLTLTKSDISATGRFLVWTVDQIEDDLSFGPHDLGIRVGINVPKFKYDPIVLNEEIKDVPGVTLYEYEVSHDTSVACSLSVYAHSEDDAEDAVREADDSGYLPYEDTTYWGDAQIIRNG